MWLDIVRIVAGLVILIVAADRLVLSAVRIAKVLSVSSVVIGAVIVGFGTSVPEFAVSAVAAGDGNIELALSNVVASNIANVTLVLGVGGLLVALTCRYRVIQREGLLMLGSVLLLAVILFSGSISRIGGAILLAAMGGALLLLLRWSKTSDAPESELEAIVAEPSRVRVEVLYGVAALVATVIASQVLLTGVQNVGREIGLSVLFMGLITGVGTSLPELSATIASARRGETDLILGNVLGSNTFNSLGVAGLAAMIGPGSTEAIGLPLIALMVGSALVAGVFAFTQQKISRVEGLALLAGFGVYVFLSI
ncbi:MAG: sodium:calcium antiporter [Armatimonadetes bacterium]|nr:MAG: sodium:calcium antiporter [Armatimonadota bacterium]